MGDNAMKAQTAVAPAIKYSPRRLAHCNLFVTDLEQSMQFFNKVCGFDDVFRESALDFGFLSNGNSHHDIGLCQISAEAKIGRDGHVQISEERGNHAGLNHFGWEMENEKALVDAYNRAISANYKIHRTTDHQISHSNYVFDPDGNLHEFYVDAMTDWRSIFHGGSGPEISGHWDPNGSPPSTDAKYHQDFELQRVDDALIHPVRITHAVMMTKNFDQMVAFFCDVGGLEIVYRSPDNDYVCVAGSHTGYACDMALFRQSPGSPNTVHHYSFEVPDETEIENAEAALRSHNIEVAFRVDNAAKRSFFIHDPEGMQFEFYVARSSEFGELAAAEPDVRPYFI
jgi:catechol 2,3-dioxygenase